MQAESRSINDYEQARHLIFSSPLRYLQYGRKMTVQFRKGCTKYCLDKVAFCRVNELSSQRPNLPILSIVIPATWQGLRRISGPNTINPSRLARCP